MNSDTDEKLNTDAQFTTPTKRLLVPRLTLLKADVDASPSPESPPGEAIITNELSNISIKSAADILSTPSTPARQRSKSVTLLASGCGAVSPLNPFDSPLKRCSSTLNESKRNVSDDHWFLSNASLNASNSSSLQEDDTIANERSTEQSAELSLTNLPPSPLTPTRQRNKSVTLLASGFEAVSPLIPFDPPLKRCSPIKDYGVEENSMNLSGDHFFLQNLSASSPNLSFDHSQYEGDEFMDEITEIRPIRRHTIAGAKHTNSTQKHESPKQEDKQRNANERSTVTTQATSTNNWDGDVYPTSNPYRYCMCSGFIMKFVRHICRPHVDRPSCIMHFCPRCKPLKPQHQRIACRSLIITFMIITITFVLLDLLILHQYLHVWLDGTLDWLASNPVAGGLAFIGIILMASLCFFPVSLLALGAGYVYVDLYRLGVGIIAAFLVCYSGCLLGAAVCFARSRYLMRQLIQKFSNRYPIVRAVDRAFASMGFRLFLLLRLSPAMPFNALNYIGGITAVSFRDYWRATCIGILPGLVWTIFVGATFGTINNRGVDGKDEFDRDSVRKGAVLGLGIGLGVMGLFGTGIYARQELTKIILAEQASEQAEASLAEVAALQHIRPQSTSEGSLSLRRDENSSGSLGDLENPQLGESLHSKDEEDEPSNHSIRRVNSERSLCNEGFHADRTENNVVCDAPWSPEAIALELPIFPCIFRRRNSFEVFQSPGVNNTTTLKEDSTEASSPTKPELGTKQQSKQLKLHATERVNDVSELWERADNHRYHYVFKDHSNRPRSNTDPVAIRRPLCKIDESPSNEENNQLNEAAVISIRRLHSMADIESIRSMTGEDIDLNETPGRNLRPGISTEVDEGIDREWFWIWD